MHIYILSVGRLKEKYLVEAQKEYLKRLKPYARLEVIEVADEGYSEGLSPAGEEQVKEKEAQRLERYLRPGTFVVALDREGKMLSSEEMAGYLADLGLRGKSEIAMLIGGSLGLAQSILKRADLKLSFSKLTFPHQLMRVILLEQIYRSFKIIKGEPYHK